MTHQSGSSIAYYILDITDAERKAAQLRSLYQGIRQDAASLAQPVVSGSGASQAQVSTRNQETVAIKAVNSATQDLIATTISLGAAQGLTTEQINAQLAALSREALAAGDLVAANELIDASLGKVIAAEERQITVRTGATQSIEQQANAELRLAGTQARALSASGNNVAALQLLTTARQNANGASQQAIATADVHIASLTRTSTATGALSGAVSSLVNPVVLLTATIGASVTVVNSFEAALKFKGTLDETDNSIRTLLRSTRDTSVVFADAEKFAAKYKLTQQETSTAIAESIPIFRNSTSATEDILSALERLTLTKPGKTFQDASRALSELQSGNAVSLNRIFDIPLVKANAMKEEIAGGADSVQVLNKYLLETGVTARALEIRTEGIKGSMRDAAIAAEKLQLAQAKFGQGPGIAILGVQTAAVNNATEVLSGNTNVLIGDLNNLVQAMNPVNLVTTLVSSSNEFAITKFNELAGTAIPKTVLSINGLTNAWDSFLQSTLGIAPAAKEATIGILRSADADDRLAAAAFKATTYVEKLTAAEYAQNRVALEDQRVGERTGGAFDNLDELTTFKDRQHQRSKEQYDDQQKAIQQAKDLQSAELGYAQATDNVAVQRKILNDQLKAAKGDAVAELNIRAQIAQLDKAQAKVPTAKGLSGLDRSEIKLAGDLQEQLAEVNHRLEDGHLTQLQRNQLLIQQAQLQEKINDAITKERDLQNEIALDAVHDAQARLNEATELEGLRRAEKDSRFSATQQEAIRLREQEILLTQQKRSNDLTKEQADLAKTVTQSGVGAVPSSFAATQGGIGLPQVPPIGSGLPVASGIPQVQLANGEKIVINLAVNVDKNGNATVTKFDPGVTLNLIGNSFATQNAAG